MDCSILRAPARRFRVGGFRSGLLLVVTLALLAGGCGKKAGSQPAAGGRAGGSPGGAPGSPPGEPPTNVAVEVTGRGTALSRYTTTATLEAENRAQILARTSGVVQRLLVEEGRSVREGQELLTLDGSDSALRLRQAEVELAKQSAIFERQKRSFEEQIIPAADFELAKTNYEAAEAAVKLAEHELSHTHVRAPFAGTVVQRLAQVGQTVNVGTPLFDIANFRALLARIYVPAKEMGTLQEGQEVTLTLDSTGEQVPGYVKLVSPVVDPATGTIKVTVHVRDYPAGTRPGDFAQVTVVTERHEDALRVPNLAVFEDKGERVVYVARDSVAERRPVQIGFIDESHTEVLSGITAGDRVIVKGQRSLKDGGRIRILEGGAAAEAAADSLRADVASRRSR
jgi:RND family efflux transporter MFP subunit